ncbi:hypothetical protein ACFWBH_00625 [Streptomyces sp. NPDC059999]
MAVYLTGRRVRPRPLLAAVPSPAKSPEGVSESLPEQNQDPAGRA